MDKLRAMGPAFLGSRLKRLGERMQAGAAKFIADAGIEVQPAQMQLLAALDGRAMTVGELGHALGISQPGVTRSIGQLVELGFARVETGGDQRRRQVTLTQKGDAVVSRARLHVWPRLGEAVESLLAERASGLPDMITRLEDALAETSMDVLASRSATVRLKIHEYSDDLAAAFRDINAEWISDMFRMEDSDRETLDDPRRAIIDPGGAILFVEADGAGIVGTCALRRTGNSGFELTKMGVRKEARGLKAGEFLLRAAIGKAVALGADPLYLLANTRSAAAIHLYEKLGFAHDAEIMAMHGKRYARCDVAMRYNPGLIGSIPGRPE